jgi:tetratricopeptide (TPR) repeat protein
VLRATELNARILQEIGRSEDALRLLGDQAETLETELGGNHPQFADVLVSRGVALAHLERFPEARADFERALAISEAIHGPDHRQVAQALRRLGFLLLETDAAAQAVPLFRRAVQILEAGAEQDTPEIAPYLTGLAKAQLQSGDPAAAAESAERALAAWGDSARYPSFQPTAKFVLAQALWRVGERRSRALALAREARDELRASRSQVASVREASAEVEAWLRAHR